MDAPAPAPTRHNGDRSDPARRATVHPRHKRHEGEDDTQRDAQRAKNPVKNRPEFFARRRRLALSRACPTPPPAAYAHKASYENVFEYTHAQDTPMDKTSI